MHSVNQHLLLCLIILVLDHVFVDAIQILLLLVKLRHDFLRLQVLVELNQLLSHLVHEVDFLQDELVEVVHVFFNIASRLVHVFE